MTGKPTTPVPPSLLYKYRVASGPGWQWARRVFTDAELYMATRASFNDPFDCRFSLSLEGNKQQLRRYVDRILSGLELSPSERKRQVAEIVRDRHQRLPQDVKTVTAQLNEALDKVVAMFCMTELPDHILMWSHYAASHTGFCLGFDASSGDSPFHKAVPIRYDEDYPVCRPVVDPPEVVQQFAVLTKASVWSYEREWRLINFLQGPGTRHFDPRFLRRVVLGMRMAPAKVRELRGLVDEFCPHAELLHAKPRPNAYGLELVPVV